MKNSRNFFTKMILLFEGKEYPLKGDYDSLYIRGFEEENSLIPVPFEPFDYCFSQDVSDFTQKELKHYIVFWDFLNSETYFVIGIYEWYFVRGKKTFEIEGIQSYLDELDEKYLQNKRYNELIKLLIRKNKINCRKLAGAGNLEMLKYAHENGCPWNEETCENAAFYGQLDCLKYAHENGCPWNLWTKFASALNEHMDCYRYACENGCP